MGSSDDWMGVADELGGRFHSVAVDLPGHGDSLGLPENEYTMERTANALLRTLDDLGIESASLVGYSMGGRLGLYLALRYPKRCERLFLESSSPGLKNKEERAIRRKADEGKAKRLESGAGFDAFLAEWYAQPLFASLDESLVEDLIERRRKNDPGELAKSLRGMGTGGQPPLWEETKNLRAPTLAVAGELDAKFAGIAREMAERSPSVSAGIVSGAGHNIHLEAPGAYLSLLEGFLNSS